MQPAGRRKLGRRAVHAQCVVRENASFASGARDQHWHKDDNAPYNARKQRHHQPVQIELLYYPQAVTAEMGPTATIPYSHY